MECERNKIHVERLIVLLSVMFEPKREFGSSARRRVNILYLSTPPDEINKSEREKDHQVEAKSHLKYDSPSHAVYIISHSGLRFVDENHTFDDSFSFRVFYLLVATTSATNDDVCDKPESLT